MVKRNSEIEQVRMFVASLLNDEQKAHAKLLAALKAQIGNTPEYDATARVLTRVYEAKKEVLEKVYRKTQGV